MGKIGSASLAIVLAGCLILREQTQQNPPANTQMQTNTSIETTVSAPQQLVHQILFQVNAEESIDISTISIFELGNLLHDTEMSRTNPIFFATSKAGPPPAVNNTYRIHLKKG